MNRRAFLSLPALEEDKPVNPPVPSRILRSTTGTAPYTGAFSQAEVKHLLRKVMFGASTSDINYFKTKTMVQAVDELLLPSGVVPDPPVNNYTNAQTPDPNVALGQTWVNAPLDANLLNQRGQSLKSWWMQQMLNQPRSIEEKMMLFWHNHFSSELRQYQDARMGYKLLVTFRQYALGNFKDLVKAITLEPSMLIYLNGYLNTKNAPDENYGRELQELFTVGKGPGSQYTEDDVKAAARVLTGYTVDLATVTSYFNPNAHDNNNKQFSAFYNNTVITGKPGNAGASELDDLLTMIFANNEVAMYLCRKLYRFFVYYDIDSTVETNVITPMAALFRSSNYEIKPVLELLFKSEHFFDMANRGAFIKPPVDFEVGLARETKLVFPDNTDVATQYFMWKQLTDYGFILQQWILDPPNVSGWPAFYQEPMFHETWINSVTYPYRNILCDAVLFQGITKAGQTVKVNPIEFVQQYSDPRDVDVLIADMIAHLHPMPADPGLNAILRSTMLSGQTSGYYWTVAWDDYVANPLTSTYKNIVEYNILITVRYLMRMPEYQLS